jgi:hypothetical protein
MSSKLPFGFEMYMCAVAPMMRSRVSPCTPVMSASATMTAITPTPTPRIETAEISEMNAWRRRAVRYRRATNHEKDMKAGPTQRPIAAGASAETG